MTVHVDPTLGQPAMMNAQDLVNDADRVVTANDAIFGTPGGPVSVIVFALWDRTDGTGGADHMACDYVNGTAIEVCASFGDSTDALGAGTRWPICFSRGTRRQSRTDITVISRDC